MYGCFTTTYEHIHIYDTDWRRQYRYITKEYILLVVCMHLHSGSVCTYVYKHNFRYGHAAGLHTLKSVSRATSIP